VTLRARLTIAFVAVVAVPLVVGLALLASALPRAVGEQQESAVLSSSRLASTVVGQVCQRARAVAEAAGRGVLSVPDGAAGQQADVLESLVARGLADGVRVTEAGGGGTTTAGQVPDEVVACGTGDSAGGTISAVVQLQQPGRGTAEAVAVVDVTDELAATLRDAAGAGDVALVDDGTVVTSTSPMPEDLLAKAMASPGRPVRADGLVAVLQPAASGAPLGVVVTEPLAEGVDVVVTALLVLPIAVVLAAGVAFGLARATTRPLEELGEAAARVASGDLATTIDVRSRDEVGVLAGAFNTMTDELRGYVGALEASRDELRAGLARLGETLTSTHDLDRILGVVLETALASTAARAGAVLLTDAASETLELAVSSGLDERATGTGLRLPVGEGVLGRVARDGEPVRGDLAGLDASPDEPSAGSIVAVPLQGPTAVLGVLALYDPRADGAGSEDDLATLRTLAGQAAVAVENVLLHRDVSRLAATDGLTGLANYRTFTQTMAREIERATRFGRPVGLLLLDIDHFKLVNDTHGHQRGDAILVELARRLSSVVRDVDTVARYGGEEFVVVLPETDEKGAELAAERVRDVVRGTPFCDRVHVPIDVTVSLGVAVYPPHGRTAPELLRRADEALYEAKRAGRDTWRAAQVPGGGAA
jgi:two-component system cell cycle response regulator